MVQDANKLVVFGSQLVGVVIVVVGLLTQQAQLHSPRPAGDKTQIVAEPDQKGDRFARLWDDPLEDLPAFALKQSPTTAPTPPAEGPSPNPTASPSPQALASRQPTLGGLSSGMCSMRDRYPK